MQNCCKMLKHPLLGLFTAVLLVLFEVTKITNAEEVEPHCSNMKRDEIELHLSTKTPYRAVANMDEHPFIYPGCHPLRVWSVVRHGTRNPSKEVIESAQDDLNRLKEQMIKKSNLCPEEIARLQYWNCNVTTEEEKFLVAEGEDEMIELAERMQKRFPELMPDIYNPNFYNFKYTKTQRTLRSAQSFATGLFGRQNIGEIHYPIPLHKDPVLRIN